MHLIPEEKKIDSEKEGKQSGNDELKDCTTSAPVSKSRSVTSDIQTNLDNCLKRSNSCVASKQKCPINLEKLAHLKRIVDNAAMLGKIFTIRGNWNIIRNQLLKRDWVEKTDLKPLNRSKNNTPEELLNGLPAKQDWESLPAYTEKCEKLVMARLLQTVETNFLWSVRRDQFDQKQRINMNRTISRFSRSLFASKEGLALLLQNYHWFTEPNVACVNFPRCYVLGFPEHFNHFVDDFRITACVCLLKYVVKTLDDSELKYSLEVDDGKIPISTLRFAMDRSSEYVARQKHLDIDKDFHKVSSQEWNDFLEDYYSLVHKKIKFKKQMEMSIMSMINKARIILRDVAKYWPEFNTDGYKNIWILKPGNKCRGRGIILVKYLKEVEKIMTLKLKYVVQKYIEKPLIIHNTKFDIRQWFLVTNAQPLTIWMYKDCYLRFSGQNFNLENFHESLHLTNYAIQCKYTNTTERSKALPKDNMWDSTTFKDYLKHLGKEDQWSNVIYPGMRESIVCSMLASQETMDRRQNTFEMYGADFILGEDLKPWLLEINCCPDMSASTSVTRRMCPQFLADIIKVVVDRKRNSAADIGRFELIYKQSLPRAPPYLGSNLIVKGRRIMKNRSIKFKQSSRTEEENRTIESTQNLIFKRKKNKLPRTEDRESYGGPVIEDLIEELQKCCLDGKSHKQNDKKGNRKEIQKEKSVESKSKSKNFHSPSRSTT